MSSFIYILLPKNGNTDPEHVFAFLILQHIYLKQVVHIRSNWSEPNLISIALINLGAKYLGSLCN